jgi:hypothetical protein
MHVTLTLEEAREALSAAWFAAEFSRENADIHQRCCDDECVAEDLADAERFDHLAARLGSLIALIEGRVPSRDELSQT